VIVTAEVDLTGSGTVLLADGVAESARVLVYADRTNEPIQAALDAIANCRHIAEGHAFHVEVKTSLTASTLYAFHVTPDGQQVVRRDGKPYRMEATRG
jgi:hypothetical protein